MEAQGQTLAKVIRMFKHYGCSEETLLTKQRLSEILNKQAAINLHSKFSPIIIDEIWGQTETTSRGESTVLTFSKIFSQAMAILQDRISIIDGPTGIMQKQAQLQVQQNKLKQLQAQYQQGFEQGYDKNNVTRKNITVIEGKIKELKTNKSDFERDLSEMQACLEIEQRLPTIQRSEYIAQSRFEESFSLPEPSPHLSLIFKVAIIATLLQFLFIGFRESFLALLCYFLIFYWLFLGYYDQHFVKVIIAGLGLSCLLDLAFAILQIMGKISNYSHTSDQKTWIYVSTAFLIIQIALRILLLIKLCMFREPSAKREYFILFDHEIELNTRSGKMLASQKNRD